MTDGLTSKTIKRIDAFTINTIGIPSMVLMERAALACSEKLLLSDQAEGTTYAIICGTGNNGGDGLAIGRQLHQAGKEVTLYLVGDTENASSEFSQQLTIAKNLNMNCVNWTTDMNAFTEDVIIDALFGIGLNRTVESPYKEAIDGINQSKGKTVALDVPSGLSADTGECLGSAVAAKETLTIGFMKKGFGNRKAKGYTGDVTVLDIGYPKMRFIDDIIKEEQNNGK